MKIRELWPWVMIGLLGSLLAIAVLAASRPRTIIVEYNDQPTTVTLPAPT